MWDNAKVEQIICAGLKPPYDGTADNLIPTLNLINVQRRNEVWYSATIIEQDGKYNLDATVRSHTRGTATYNNRSFSFELSDGRLCCSSPLENRY